VQMKKVNEIAVRNHADLIMTMDAVLRDISFQELVANVLHNVAVETFTEDDFVDADEDGAYSITPDAPSIEFDDVLRANESLNSYFESLPDAEYDSIIDVMTDIVADVTEEVWPDVVRDVSDSMVDAAEYREFVRSHGPGRV